MSLRRRLRLAYALPILALALVAAAGRPASTQGRVGARQRPPQSEVLQPGRPDFVRMLAEQARTDQAWRDASDGVMQMEKIAYRSMRGDLSIPAFVFQPLDTRGPRTHPAIVWVHENIRGHLYEHYIPYIREATARGFIVIAPEYRGSIGYGEAFYDAIDYGGAEVDDVVTAAAVVVNRYPAVDPSRVGIAGWSHGGLITLLAIFRNPTTFKAAAALVPVTNLFHRLARKGVEEQRRAIDPRNRFGGTPSQRPEIYRNRSPLFWVDRLQIPLLVHVADNDEDVDLDEAMPLVDALRARKPALSDVKIYRNPPGGHVFDRLVVAGTSRPEGTLPQRDSWDRVWSFLDKHLEPAYN